MTVCLSHKGVKMFIAQTKTGWTQGRAWSRTCVVLNTGRETNSRVRLFPRGETSHRRGRANTEEASVRICIYTVDTRTSFDQSHSHGHASRGWTRLYRTTTVGDWCTESVISPESNEERNKSRGTSNAHWFPYQLTAISLASLRSQRALPLPPSRSFFISSCPSHLLIPPLSVISSLFCIVSLSRLTPSLSNPLPLPRY